MTRSEFAVDNPVAGFTGVVCVGPLVFTSGYDGHRDRTSNLILPSLSGDAESQSENSYGKICDQLALAGKSAAHIVRLDHYTSSQDWLATRAGVRARVFGRPAQLASTGVASKMAGINMLTTAAIGVSDLSQKEVLITGREYRMENISTLVRGGPFLFMSGVRGTYDFGTGSPVEEETETSFTTQLNLCYRMIREILSRALASTSNIVRLDSYIRDRSKIGEAITTQHAMLPDAAPASFVAALPLGMRGEVEINALAVAPGQHVEAVRSGREGQVVASWGGGFLFVGQQPGADDVDGRPRPELAGNSEAQLDNALNGLVRRLELAGSSVNRLIRLELFLRDINRAERAHNRIRKFLGGRGPALLIAGAESEGISELQLGAIAH